MRSLFYYGMVGIAQIEKREKALILYRAGSYDRNGEAIGKILRAVMYIDRKFRGGGIMKSSRERYSAAFF